MGTNPYTAKEFREFDRLTEDMSSRVQMARISARLAMTKFVAKHGKEKCDAMWAEIQRRDAKANAGAS